MGYLNNTLGSGAEPGYQIPGINRVALIEKSKVTAITGTTTVTALTLEATSLFQEIFLEEGSGSFTQELTNSNSAKYITQTLTFKVGSDDLESTNDVILGRRYMALVEDKSGKWYLAGITSGIRTSAWTGANTEEDALQTFTMTARNLGPAALVTVTDIEALINDVEL